MKKYIIPMLCLGFFIAQFNTASAQIIYLGDLGSYDLSSMKKYYDLDDFDTLDEDCYGNVTCYVGFNDLKVIITERACGDVTHKLFLVFANDELVGALKEEYSAYHNEAKQILTNNQALLSRTSGTTDAAQQGWVPMDTQQPDYKTIYDEIESESRDIINRYEKAQIEKNQKLKARQAIWSKNKFYYAYFDKDGSLYVYNRNGIKEYTLANTVAADWNNYVELQSDGNLCFKDANGAYRWGSKQAFKHDKEAHYLRLSNDGILELVYMWYDVFWKSHEVR